MDQDSRGHTASPANCRTSDFPASKQPHAQSALTDFMPFLLQQSAPWCTKIWIDHIHASTTPKLQYNLVSRVNGRSCKAWTLSLGKNRERFCNTPAILFGGYPLAFPGHSATRFMHMPCSYMRAIVFLCEPLTRCMGHRSIALTGRDSCKRACRKRSPHESPRLYFQAVDRCHRMG